MLLLLPIQKLVPPGVLHRSMLPVVRTVGGSTPYKACTSLEVLLRATVKSRRRFSELMGGVTRICTASLLILIETWAIDQEPLRRRREQRQIQYHITRSGPCRSDPTIARDSPRGSTVCSLDSRRGRRAGCSPRLRLGRCDIRAPRAPPPSRRRRPFLWWCVASPSSCSCELCPRRPARRRSAPREAYQRPQRGN